MGYMSVNGVMIVVVIVSVCVYVCVWYVGYNVSVMYSVVLNMSGMNRFFDISVMLMLVFSCIVV